MSLNLQKIEALAPDQGSLDAVRKLLKPGGRPTLAEDGAGLLWGECQGSGATPYRVCVTEIDAGYKCSCPSRKFPCKHALALMWMRADGKVAFVTAAPPDGSRTGWRGAVDRGPWTVGRERERERYRAESVDGRRGRDRRGHRSAG